jgi:hypothetical protein
MVWAFSSIVPGLVVSKYFKNIAKSIGTKIATSSTNRPKESEIFQILLNELRLCA